MTDFKLTINGVTEDSSQFYSVINPATEETIGNSPEASKIQLDRAVVAANTAFCSWSQTSREDRVAALRAFAEKVQLNMDYLARLNTLEQGKPLQESINELNACLGWLEYYVNITLPAQILVDDSDSRIELQHKPLGVVGGITPWNAPLMVACNKIIPAVLTGNTLVLKPSPYTPLATLKLGELAQEVFPAGVVNVLSGGNELGRWMAEHPDIHKISFTGSSATGKAIMTSAACNLKRLTLELGGNDAGIVLKDIDIPATVEKLFWAAFYNSGQICAALKRLYVHEDIYESLGAALAQYSSYIKMGNGLEEGNVLGPLQNEMQFNKVCELAKAAEQEGGRFLCGGKAMEGKGFFFPVTLVADLNDDARLVREEQFGPILPIIKFSDIDQVVAAANSGPNGLGGSVWTSDLEQGERIARRLQCGSVWVNKHMDVRPDVPFGGAKESGLGTEHTALGLAEYTQLQVVNIAKQ